MHDKAINLALMRIDEHQIPGEPSAPQIARYHRANRAGPCGGTDQRNGPRIE